MTNPRRNGAPPAIERDKLPPFDADAEGAVIATALVDEELIPTLAAIVRADDFYREANRWTWEAILALRSRGEAVTQITVAHQLARSDRLDGVGGVAFLARLVADLPTTVGSEWYAEIVRRDASYRRLIGVGAHIVRLGHEGGPNLDDVLLQSLDLLHSVQAGAADRAMRPGSEILAGLFEAPLEQHGVAPPWAGLRQFLPVLRSGKLYVLAGHTSNGKTSLALDMMRALVASGVRVLLFSLEMDEEEIRARLLASTSGVDSERIQAGLASLSDQEQRRVNEAAGALGEGLWWVDDRTRDVRDIESRAKAHQMRHGCDLLIVDHLQELSTPNARLNKTEATSENCERLRDLAASMEVPVLLISQLRREASPGEEPTLADLRQSGRIEEAAAAVLLLFQGTSGPMQLIVAKNRMGARGRCPMKFWPTLCRFTDERGEDRSRPMTREAL